VTILSNEFKFNRRSLVRIIEDVSTAGQVIHIENDDIYFVGSSHDGEKTYTYVNSDKKGNIFVEETKKQFDGVVITRDVGFELDSHREVIILRNFSSNIQYSLILNFIISDYNNSQIKPRFWKTESM